VKKEASRAAENSEEYPGVGERTMTKKRIKIKLPKQKIEEFCRRHHIRRLAVFGSALREDFRPGSDLDVLVEFDPEHIPGLIALAGMEIELSRLLGGRKVDMNTPLCLSPFFRDEALAEAEPVYVAG
jgi:predicted nucleotidyltransferase